MLKIETGKTNEVLRKISEKIEISELKKYQKLGKEMAKYLKDEDNNGVGLAAPQVGVNKRMIAICLFNEKEDEIYAVINMINPRVLEHSESTEVDEEGCLSVPGERGDVVRYSDIKVKFLDFKGRDKTLLLSGLNARIVQHEIDHLDGVLFIDKLV